VPCRAGPLANYRPEYITQCPIQPGANFTYRIIFSEEEGTVWWHAHSDFDRATVHGAIVIHPKRGSAYPYTKPHKEMPIILGTSMDHLDFQYCYGLHACYDDW